MDTPDDALPSTPSTELIEAVQLLWSRTQPTGLFKCAEFAQLREVCAKYYAVSQPFDGLSFALYHCVRAAGVPCELPDDRKHLALSAYDAAVFLIQALSRTESRRIHLCPLDCADDLPELKFGPACIKRLSEAELAEIMNADQLRRYLPAWNGDFERLSSFHWLIVNEKVTLTKGPEQRALPFLYESFNWDLGGIEPHPQRFPELVETAMFALLLMPWEDWVSYPSMDWRPFLIPWVYTIEDDVLIHRSAPPSADSLSWEPAIYTDRYGDEVELERPCVYHLGDISAYRSLFPDDSTWDDLQHASQTCLFDGPVLHFLNRAYLSSGIDEFLAHITAIEAGLGAEIDHDVRRRPKVNGANPGATVRIATRLSILLKDDACYDGFRRIFEARSEFVHGRTMRKIKAEDRLLARRLARRMAAELVARSRRETHPSRELFLQYLLSEKLQ